MVNERKPASGEDALARLLVSHPAGAFVFREGESGEEMYIIQEGSVEILKQFGPSSKRLATLEAGDFFGEMSMLENRPRSASARVTTDAKLLPVDPSTFDQMLREYPEVAVRMLRSLCARMRKYEDEAQAANQLAGNVLGEAQRHELSQLTPIAAETPAAAPQAAATTGAKLVHASGTQFPLPSEGEVVVGRLDPVTQLSPEVDLSQLDPQRSMSRRHAKIRCDGGTYVVREEIGTSNGTWLDGAKLATGVEHPIQNGSRLRFGRVDVVLQVG
jgi:CRP-like cAMP-binding protein